MRDRRQPSRMTREGAEDIAAKAFLFLAEESERLGRFMAETGIDPATLKASLGDPATLAAVLGHVLADESALLAFTANAGIRPEDVAKAEAALGGGSHWESS